MISALEKQLDAAAEVLNALIRVRDIECKRRARPALLCDQREDP